jgi:uncharacterized protein YegL
MQTNSVESPRPIGRMHAPRQFSQLALAVLDGSGSMAGASGGNITKADAANGAFREMLTRFKAGCAIANFTFGVITFDDAPVVRLPPTEGTQVDDNADYNPMNGHGGGTCIYRALESAEMMIQEFLENAPAGGVYHSAVILLMSDGECSDPDRTRAIAARIKQRFGARVTIAASFFGTLGVVDPPGAALLKDVASDPVRLYKTSYDADTLRAFFEASTSMASGGIKVV